MAIFGALEPDAPALIDADDRHSPYWVKPDIEPWPARDLIDVSSYRYTIDGVPALSLIAQLGCPFGCGFCAGRHSPSLRHIRMRSADNVVAEMRHMADTYGTRGFMFYDDELNVNRGMIEMMEKIANGSRDWRLRGFIKAELFTDAQAAAMRAAGFRWILVGFESGSPRILDNINKRATQHDNSECMAIARRHGLKVKALMSLGHPGESEQTIAETRRWLLDERPDDFDVTIITPYPGSPYYDDASEMAGGVFTYTARSGDRLHQREIDYSATADYYKGMPGEYVSHVWTDHLSVHDLVAERDQLESAVRGRLGIAFNPAAAAVSYEHSMGQTALPPRLLRSSHG
jgi:pyruvate-formate lyase-activating enzyme